MADLHEIDRLAGRRRGLTTTSDLTDAGFSRRDVTDLHRRGIIHQVRRGVYRTLGVPADRELIYLAAALAAGNDPVLSHWTAAYLWQFRYFPVPGAIDLLAVGTQRPRMPGVNGHRTLLLPDSHRTTLRGMPLTTVERTFVDCCAALPYRLLERCGDDLQRRKLLSIPRLAATIEEVPVSGRRALVPARRYLERYEGTGRLAGGSDRELDVRDLLERAGIRPLPDQQVQVRCAGGRTFEVDHGWPIVREGFEFMGFDPHGNLVSRFHHDQDRLRLLQRAGWRLWPVTSRTTAEEITAIALEIVARIRQAAA